MYETFEHTADIGLRVRAVDLNHLFTEAARAMFSVMVANPDEIRAVERAEIELPADQPDELLRRWLAELLYRFHVERMLFWHFDVEVRPEGLRATAWGEPIDAARHEMDVEIKAVTWHGLRLEPQPDGWLAEVIVDL